MTVKSLCWQATAKPSAYVKLLVCGPAGWSFMLELEHYLVAVHFFFQFPLPTSYKKWSIGKQSADDYSVCSVLSFGTVLLLGGYSLSYHMQTISPQQHHPLYPAQSAVVFSSISPFKHQISL